MSIRLSPRLVLAAALSFGLAAALLTPQAAQAVPSFARQTGMACEACHTVFPELTPFGRRFKLNGYLLDNLPQVKAITPDKDEALLLNWLPPLSLMFQVSYTQTKTAVPDLAAPGGLSQNGQVLFPQEASLFYAGRIAPKLGGFIQLTYESDSGNVALDNTDIRFADQAFVDSSAGRDRSLIYGFTLNNNPTVQDVWNSTPAWEMPFNARTTAAPMPAASTQIDGPLAQSVAGVSAYGFWMNSVYAELGVYRSAPQGFSNAQTGLAGPLNSTASDVISGLAPYWRVAYEMQWAHNALSFGLYGLTVNLFPGNGSILSGPTNNYTDAALDSQYQFISDDNIVSFQATYIHERQDLNASVAVGLASNATDTLRTLHIGGSYYYGRKYGGSLGYFSTTGTTDPLLYPASPVVGSASGSPDSNGWIAELDYLPWQNVKLALQYTFYDRFNGSSTNYDGFGRNASGNNTLFVLGWVAF
jgi:hypothetical protein